MAPETETVTTMATATEMTGSADCPACLHVLTWQRFGQPMKTPKSCGFRLSALQ